MPTTIEFSSSPQMLEARQQLVKIASLLIRQEHRIFEIQQALPLPASHLAMEEQSIPYCAASWMYVELDRIQARGLRSTVRKLLSLSKKTDHELAIEFCDLVPEVDEEGDVGREFENKRTLRRLREIVLEASEKVFGNEQEETTT